VAGMGIRVTPEQLQQVSAQVGAGAASIDGTLRQLAAQVGPLGSDWAGVAQSRFIQLWTEWQRSAAGLQHALTGIGQLTAAAAVNYEQTEQGIAASFGRA
jgi:6 kDa early secretory antigenic target